MDLIKPVIFVPFPRPAHHPLLVTDCIIAPEADLYIYLVPPPPFLKISFHFLSIFVHFVTDKFYLNHFIIKILYFFFYIVYLIK